MLSTSDKIRLSGTIKESIVDGPGMRYVIFTQGCLKRCFLCHNADTQPLDGGYIEQTDNIVNEFIKNPLIQGITISGGEPFLQAKACLYLAKKAHEHQLDVYIYSGYKYEELIKSNEPSIISLLEEADFLIDGPFINDLKSYDLLFRGSSNQRLIDLKKTKKSKELVVIV